MTTLSEDDHATALRLRGMPDEEQTAFISQIVRECKWNRSRSVKELADLWGIRPGVVKAMHAKACWGIQATVAALAPTLPFEILEKIDYVVNSAMSAKKAFLTMEGDIVYADAPDHKSALQGLGKIADMIGLTSKNPNNPMNNKQFADASLEDLMRLAKEEIGGKRLISPINTKGEEIDGEKTAKTIVVQATRSEDSLSGGPDGILGREHFEGDSGDPVDGDGDQDPDEWEF